MTAPTLDVDPFTHTTPVESRAGRWYKRDDLLRFSNGVNGKVRVSLHLARQARDAGATALVYGGSVHAPALGRVASAAAHTGLRCKLVIGSDPAKAVRHDTVRVAADTGAELIRSPVAYNPALQARARALAADSGGTTAQIAYGVSTPPDTGPDQLRAFLDVDAPQVANLPATIRTLIVPFGSGNAAASVLYGLATAGAPDALERVVLVGIGPPRWEWLWGRLAAVGVNPARLPVELVDLHASGFTKYADRMPETLDGIRLHPTYEGKIARYLNQTRPPWWTARDGTACLWIVGGPL
jgi:hypothetical protein